MRRIRVWSSWRPFKERNPEDIPAVLVREHGPFVWGKDPDEAVYHAVVLEQLAPYWPITTAALRAQAGSVWEPMQQELLDKHFSEKARR